MHKLEHTPQFLLYDSTLLDLGSAFDHYISLGTCALVKQYAKIFMLSGSIQFSLPFHFKSNHAKFFLNNAFESF